MRNEFGRILLAVDGSKLSKKAAKKALKLSKESEIPITALHVIDIPYMPDTYTGEDEIPYEEVRALLTTQGKGYLDEVHTLAEEMGVTVSIKIREGHIANEILDESKTNDLIIIGSKGRNSFEKALLGSIAEKVTRHAPCPVMVVK